jgi:hypothetical protein
MIKLAYAVKLVNRRKVSVQRAIVSRLHRLEDAHRGPDACRNGYHYVRM